MIKQQIIEAYTKLGELVAKENELGIQLIQFTAEQRKAHQAVLEQKDIINHLDEDENLVVEAQHLSERND